MKINFIIVVLFSFLILNKGQGQGVYSVNSIHSIADSILLGILNNNTVIKKYFRFDENTYYIYEDDDGKLKPLTLVAHHYTKGKFVSINYRWLYKIPLNYSDSEDTITGGFSINLNSEFTPSSRIGLEFIPEKYFHPDSSELFNKHEAYNIALEHGFIDNIDSIISRVFFDNLTKRILWEFSRYSIYGENENIGKFGYVNTIQVDAKNGVIVSRNISTYTERMVRSK